ncbi:MAG: histidine kinase [Actinobacteria bacterium]|nr:histidine kinase [Actinomycetota bacterium]
MGAAAVVQVVASPDDLEPRGITAACALIATLALAWRRVAPLPAVVAYAAAVALPTVYIDISVQGPATLAAALIMVYSVGAHLSLRPALSGLAVFAAGLVVHELRAAIGENIAAAAFFWLLSGTAWLVGRYVRRHREAGALAERSAQLEREREANVQAAVAHERTRIARELHDIVSHSVSVIVVQAEAAEEVLHADAARAAAPLRTIQGAGREALTEMRRMLGVLRADGGDTTFGPRPGVERVPELVGRVQDAGVQVELRVEGAPARLAPGVDLAIYRVVQEALTNVLRHSGAAHAGVLLRYGVGSVEVEVTDDGRGGDASGHAGRGIIGMRERVRLFDGEFNAGARPEGGFGVRASFPTA